MLYFSHTLNESVDAAMHKLCDVQRCSASHAERSAAKVHIPAKKTLAQERRGCNFRSDDYQNDAALLAWGNASALQKSRWQ
jgi:hypothetical protein